MPLNRRKAPKMGVRAVPKQKSIPAFLQYVRGFQCLAMSDRCMGGIEAHHIRKGLGEDAAGFGQKPADRYVVPLCAYHHSQTHQLGHDTFEQRHGLNLLENSNRLWQQWPGRIKWEKNQWEK